MNAFPGIKQYFSFVKKKSWDNGYILINEKTGHKCFIPDWEELKIKERSFTKEFWDLYRTEKADNTEQFRQVLYPLVSNYFKRRGDIDRMALNYCVQGSSAIVTKIAGIKLFDYLCNHNLLFIVLIPNLVHDEILVECPKELEEEMSKVTQDSMEGAGRIFCKTVTLKAVPEVASYWKH